MNIYGLDSIATETSIDGFFVKCIANRSGALFFPGTTQHRDAKREGLSYEDDYRGNALAATITPGMIDLRFHSGFTDEVVAEIFSTLLHLPEMRWAASYTVRYQGRELLS